TGSHETGFRPDGYQSRYPGSLAQRTTSTGDQQDQPRRLQAPSGTLVTLGSVHFTRCNGICCKSSSHQCDNAVTEESDGSRQFITGKSAELLAVVVERSR